MSRKYHILKTTCPTELLSEHGYPTGKDNKSQSQTWFAFDGRKETDLEGDFAEYEVTDPPAYMTQTKNMTVAQCAAIIDTVGASEAEGWLADGE